MADLVSRTTRGLFRDLMTDSTLRQIEHAFQDGGFPPVVEAGDSVDTSVRRRTTQAYLDAVAWADPGHVRRFLMVAERLLHGWEARYLEQFWRSLERDGVQVDRSTGELRTNPGQLDLGRLDSLQDPSAIQEGLRRLRDAVDQDPALAIGGAKELIESTAKVALRELGHDVDERADLPALTRQAQEALGLHPAQRRAAAAEGSGSAAASHALGPDASDAVRRILGGVTTIAAGLGELRNRGYGTGHGPATARVGLQARHGRLAVNAAITWCQLVLDTLADPQAPWRGPATTPSRSVPPSPGRLGM